MLAKRAAGVLIKRLHLVRHLAPVDNADAFDHAETETPCGACQRLVALNVEKRLEKRGNAPVDEMLKPSLNLFGDFATGLLVDKRLRLRLQRVIASLQFPDRVLAPHEPALFGEVHFGVGGVVKPVGAKVKFRLKRLHGGGTNRLRLVTGGRRILMETERFEAADELAFDSHLALVVYFGHKALLLFQPAKQNRCPPINKSFRERVVKRVRQAVFYSARRLAPMAFVLEPALALRDIGPGADIGQTLRQRVDVAVGAVNAVDLARQPVFGDAAVLVQIREYAADQLGVLLMADAAKIRDAADIPQQLHGTRV